MTRDATTTEEVENAGPPAGDPSPMPVDPPPPVGADGEEEPPEAAAADNEDAVDDPATLSSPDKADEDGGGDADADADAAVPEEKKAVDSDDEEPLPSEKFDVNPDDLLLRATIHKSNGNAEFKTGDYAAAARSYRKGTNLLRKVLAPGDEQVTQLLLALQTNLSMVLHRQGKHRMSRDVASKALETDGKNVKALYRRAVASRTLGDFDAARSDLREALKADPKNVPVKKELAGIKKQVDDAKNKEKARLQRAFSKGGESLLYSDREEEEKKKAERKKEEEKQKEEELKKRRIQWENECVKRMASDPPEEAISFEDWEKERKCKDDKAAKARKKEREEKRRKEREARKKANKENESDDDDDELTEKELAMLRGYKKTSDGRTTSYFNREQSEEEKKLVGCIKPKKLDQSASPPSPSPTSASKSGVGSAWNQSGTTWEEKDTTDWCKKTLERCLLDVTSAYYSTTTDDATYVAVVSEVKDLTGDASVAIAGGKKRYIYDFHLSVEYEIRDEAEETVASGKLRLPDVNSATTSDEEELDVEVMAWKKAPSAGKDVIHVVQDAVECQKVLVQDVRKGVLQFVEKFNTNF